MFSRNPQNSPVSAVTNNLGSTIDTNTQPCLQSPVQHGIMLCFEKFNQEKTLLQNIVSMATHGSQIHVEVTPACRFDTPTPHTGYTHILDTKTYTAFMGRPFDCYPVSPSRYHPETWDFVFVPTTTETRDCVLAWAETQRGAPYDYFHAFTCPVLPAHASLLQHTNRNNNGNGDAQTQKDHPSRVFCSQAALYMLKAGGLVSDRLSDVVPERCSPAALYRILTGENNNEKNNKDFSVEIVDGWACAMAKQSFTTNNIYNPGTRLHTRPPAAFVLGSPLITRE